MLSDKSILDDCQLFLSRPKENTQQLHGYIKLKCLFLYSDYSYRTIHTCNEHAGRGSSVGSVSVSYENGPDINPCVRHSLLWKDVFPLPLVPLPGGLPRNSVFK